MSRYVLEVCANSTESALAAQAGGAGRVELCGNIPEGGTTPSFGTIKTARNLLTLKLHVIIRPRGGDFCYTDTEFGIMKEDILMCRELGVDGVVFGILLHDGPVDVRRTGHLAELARPMSVTFHRAFDMARDPSEALDAVIGTGACRILTSGGRNKAADGLDTISRLVQKAGERIIIMPGSGIHEGNIREIRERTGASEFHVSARGRVTGAMTFRKEGISMGGSPAASEYDREVTDPGRVREMIRLLNEGFTT
ncbi:MAG: copper homeostasis protein CutC [Bacteroidales bacterium]|nr:copper homeostasis protein CutC [Bacteroidales bacterium]